MTVIEESTLPQTIRLDVAERVDRDLERILSAATTAHDGAAGVVVCSAPREADVTAALHGAGRHTTSSAGPTGLDGRATVAIAVDEGAPTWIVHLDAPATIDAYVADVAERVPDGVAAALLTAPADFARARAAADRDVARLAAIDALQGYTEWSGCRRELLAGWLGRDDVPAPCGTCDNCLQPPAGLLGAEDARHAVDAVAETGERFGMKHLVSVLRGERTETVVTHRHDKLAAWKRGPQLTRAQWDAVLRQLLAAGILRYDDNGGIVRTPLAQAVQAGDRSVSFARHQELPEAPMPKRRGAPARAAGASGGGSPRTTTRAGAKPSTSARAREEAKRRLYRWRTAFANELGVPAIRVLTDPDITSLVVRRPTSMEELRRLITPSRCDAYGEAILAAVADLG